MYNQKVLDAFAHPQNVGEIENPDGEGTVGNATCGDIMRITLRIENDVIVTPSFKRLVAQRQLQQVLPQRKWL